MESEIKRLDRMLIRQGAMVAGYQAQYKKIVFAAIKKHNGDRTKAMAEIRPEIIKLAKRIIQQTFRLGEQWLNGSSFS